MIDNFIYLLKYLITLKILQMILSGYYFNQKTYVKNGQFPALYIILY